MVYVFSDSVLRLGKMGTNPIESWKKQIQWYSETNYFSELSMESDLRLENGHKFRKHMLGIIRFVWLIPVMEELMVEPASETVESLLRCSHLLGPHLTL